MALMDRLRLPFTFWMLCIMEMWERLAYYGVRVVVAIYIAQADEPGGLHFTQADKGTIYLWWFVFQSILPTFTGGLADRYGYKRTIFVSITLKLIGYILMGTQTSYVGFFIGTMLLATGTALFKPGIQGSLQHNLTDKTSSSGWGTFYWLVNVGAMIGPPLAGYLRQMSWDWVFFGCAAIVSINYLMLFTYKDPESGYDSSKGFATVMKETFSNLLNARLLAFLAILSGFWLMMYQLWDLHPNFLTDWNNSSGIASLPFVPEAWTKETDRGVMVLQENLLNLNAALIVLLVVPISVMVAKIRTLTSMVMGMGIAILGILVSGLTQSGFIFLFGVLFFSLGEMLTGPKKNEYLGLIAPEGKKGLFLGYVNIPVGVGGAIGSKLAGYLYGNYGEKAILAQKYLCEKTDYLKQKGLGPWDGEVSSLTKTLGGIDRTNAYETLKLHLGQDGTTVTNLLWNTYEPYVVWYPIAAIGLISTLALVVFAMKARKWADMNK